MRILIDTAETVAASGLVLLHLPYLIFSAYA